MGDRIMQKRRGRGYGLPILLVALGIFLFIAQLMGFSLLALAWPLFILIPGILLFALVRSLGRSAALLTIPATMITAVGLLLQFQALTGYFASWAYAWSLIFPTAFGLGLSFYGDLARKPTVADTGETVAKVGLGLFLFFFLFFELFVGLGGWLSGLIGTLLLPALLIGGGIYLLRRRRGGRRRGHSVYRRSPPQLGDTPPLFEDELDEIREQARVKRRKR